MFVCFVGDLSLCFVWFPCLVVLFGLVISFDKLSLVCFLMFGFWVLILFGVWLVWRVYSFIVSFCDVVLDFCVFVVFCYFVWFGCLLLDDCFSLVVYFSLFGCLFVCLVL